MIELAAFQPEHTKAAGAYVTGLVGQARIDAGRQLAATHAELLGAIEAAYGVDRHILVAIWGVESRYGTEMGSRNIIRSLATLAMADMRRAPFWTKELIAALRMVQDGRYSRRSSSGSWAGAMGHTQFIPSTYSARAVDFDKDGRRDIWETVADALASSANYLQASGWVAGAPVGLRGYPAVGLRLCAGRLQGARRTLAEWLAAGVQIVANPLRSGAQGTAAADRCRPGREDRHSWSRAISAALRKYNQSTSYALAVGHLADRIAGGAALAAAWPADDTPLNRAERAGAATPARPPGASIRVDWTASSATATRAAIRATQRTLRLAEDGHPSFELLHRLRGNGGP